jgi:hypothetical protein
VLCLQESNTYVTSKLQCELTKLLVKYASSIYLIAIYDRNIGYSVIFFQFGFILLQYDSSCSASSLSSPTGVQDL